MKFASPAFGRSSSDMFLDMNFNVQCLLLLVVTKMIFNLMWMKIRIFVFFAGMLVVEA